MSFESSNEGEMLK